MLHLLKLSQSLEVLFCFVLVFSSFLNLIYQKYYYLYLQNLFCPIYFSPPSGSEHNLRPYPSRIWFITKASRLDLSSSTIIPHQSSFTKSGQNNRVKVLTFLLLKLSGSFLFLLEYDKILD